MSTYTFIYFHYAGCYNVFMETKLFTEERQDEIINLLKERKSVTVQNLSDYFGVSGATIRTDLSVLEKKGCLRRTHGGAVLPKSVETYLQELGIHERSHFQEKKAIAEAALKYVSSHETILIDNGTTISAFCTALAGSSLSGLTVYSNDLYGMQILESKENCELHLIGGCIRSGFHYTYGQQVLDELGSYHFKKLFLATSAVSADGLTVLDNGRMVYDGADHKDLTVEGPKAYKRDGMYWILCPAGGVKTGYQLALRSKNIYGPYERRVVLCQGSTPVNGPHQGGWVNDGHGNDFYAILYSVEPKIQSSDT